jgi:hypothetical protein
MSVVFKEPDKILADILTVFMALDPTRVVLYDENWNPPKDQGIYITIQTDQTETVGISQEFDGFAGTNESSLSAFQRLTVNITSRDRSALQRKEEVAMALTSIYSQQQQELQQCRIFREGPILDLSFIEASKALHRYQIPVKIVYVKSIVLTGASVPVIAPSYPTIVEEA